MSTTSEHAQVFPAAGAALLLACLFGCASANPEGAPADLAGNGAVIQDLGGSPGATPAAQCVQDGLALIEWTDETWAAYGSLMQSAPSDPTLANILFLTPIDWGLLSTGPRDAIAYTKEDVDTTPEPSSSDDFGDSGPGCLVTTDSDVCLFFDD